MDPPWCDKQTYISHRAESGVRIFLVREARILGRNERRI